MAAAVAEDDPSRFLSELKLVRGSREQFRQARAAFSQLADNPGSQWDFMLRCLESLGASHPPPGPATLAPLISGLRKPPPVDEDGKVGDEASRLRRRALDAALTLRALGNPVEGPDDSREATRPLRNAARIVEMWDIAEPDVREAGELDAIERMLGELFLCREWEQLADLLPSFPSLAAQLDFPSEVAELKARHSLPRQGRRLARRLTEASWGVTQREEETIEKEVAAGEPLRAVAACGLSQRLRRRCAERLLEAGHADLVVDLAESWWLPAEVTAEARAAQAERAGGFVQLPQEVELLMVDREDQLVRSFARLEGAALVGLDVEMYQGDAVLVQLAVRETALLVDVLALGGSPALGEAFARLLNSERTTVLGFGLRQDVRSLRRLPGLELCSRRLDDSLLDVQTFVAQRRASQLENGSVKQEIQGLSLSSLTESLLGKPLDKSLRMSDWRRRPLIGAQRRYAALDAWVLPEIFERLSE